MFASIKQIFAPKNKDLRNRILFTLGALLIFNLGTNIAIPGISISDILTNTDGEAGFLELLDAMGGGALKQFSIFALGVMPYISASIVIQLLQMDIVPYFSDLAKEGQSGRQKLNKITRYAGILFAFVQAYAMSIAFVKAGIMGSELTTFEYMKISIILTAGTAFLLWLGDQITQKGIGNGISLIIMAGIVSTIPTMFKEVITTVLGSAPTVFVGIVGISLFILLYLAIIVGVIFIQESERRIPIQYSNRTTSAYGAKQTYMPFKLNSAGVIPVIFASSFIAIPTTLSQIIANEGFQKFVAKYLSFSSATGLTLYLLLIMFFAYFYTFMQINPDELSKNLNKNGGYIPGVRPGKETSDYIKKILSRLTIFGAIFLIIIAGLPVLVNKFSSLPTTVTVGGTGLLIVVGVALETYKQLESRLNTRSYQDRRNY